MIKVLFFAQVKALVGCDAIELDDSFTSVEQIRTHLCAKGDQWARALEDGRLLVAVNQVISSFDAKVNANDEVAFFPPVTGG